MLFNQIIGQEHIKKHLQTSAENGRIPHAQLFVGKEGCGTLPMAIAYAQFLLCNFSDNVDACNLKCNKLQHPDLHFAFPVTTNDSVKKHPVSNLFLEDWREFIETQLYGSLFNWLQHIGVENKQGLIGVDEAEAVVKKLKLKSYEGGFKVMIIWMAEKMNIAAANKLLKLIEEPPEKTVFLLITENEEQIINTIKSRCQALHFPALSEQDIANALVVNHQVDDNKAANIAHQAEGNFNKALHLLHNDSSDLVFEEWFVTWIRTAFKAKGNTAVVQQLIGWSESIAKSGRETQKRFLEYCLQFFRQALLLNYKSDNLVFMESKTGFQLSKFAPFVHSGNILDIEKEISEAMYHIERNGNAKIILLDLSMKLTRFLHKKEAKV
ncbi:DNA polymerase III subunit delta' [Polaribacter reichenbachii]|uniref:DNA polymerase III subunit delta n=1 Tax=Polaribacter reichenbachii TaxID=996801 RepID=A0A1B8TWQ3_9FLAO|nr:DNA polymerase III subunit delta' [Polaribacter reichenbachii]APZ45606.1 DNA polymerase III subunit delta' [Polaribacter reichenbachii]AUC19468.1 DNA polymerase III subunit delta' [Polaribacter reichenbachii]OBY63994.1 DNA polymerase III subunit delta' [Polaribacter reichenbachii]